MQIYATFDHSIHVELVITKLQKIGVSNLFAVPLDNSPQELKLFDTIHRSDGDSLINKGMILAVIFSVITASRGFNLKWGPIYWGLIGAIAGFIFGVLIDVFLHRRKNKTRRKRKNKQAEVILIIECKEEEAKQVEKIIWEHFAFGFAKIKTFE
ncbi:MAG: hypothetical protein ABF649_10450 [Bacillus sp. (in: firmicutes)]